MKERSTHDDQRYGSTTLFAALDTATCTVMCSCMQRHWVREFRVFFDKVERNIPADFDILVDMDAISSHNTRLIRDRFAKWSSWHRHFTPISYSWLDYRARSRH